MPRGRVSQQEQIELAAMIRRSPAQIVDIGRQAAMMTKVGLPVTDPGDDLLAWGRTDGQIELVLNQGVRIVNGVPTAIGYPFGYYARRFELHLITEAARTENRTINLGGINACLAAMNLGKSGGTKGVINNFKKQVVRLVNSSIAIRYVGDSRVAAGGLVPVAEAHQLWLGRDDDAGKHPDFVSQVVLGETFFNSIVTDPVVVDLRVVEALGKALQVDIYLWLLHLLADIDEPTLISWETLRSQFGLQLADTAAGRSQFKTQFTTALNIVLEHFEDGEVKVDVDRQVGVWVFPPAKLIVAGFDMATVDRHTFGLPGSEELFVQGEVVAAPASGSARPHSRLRRPGSGSGMLELAGMGHQPATTLFALPGEAGDGAEAAGAGPDDGTCVPDLADTSVPLPDAGEAEAGLSADEVIAEVTSLLRERSSSGAR